MYESDAYAGLMQVSASGGVPQPLTFPDEGEIHKQADFLPDGGVLFFTIGVAHILAKIANIPRLQPPAGAHDLGGRSWH